MNHIVNFISHSRYFKVNFVLSVKNQICVSNDIFFKTYRKVRVGKNATVDQKMICGHESVGKIRQQVEPSKVHIIDD